MAEMGGAYTLHVLGIECLTAQELNGDDVYLTLDERRIWSVGRAKMSHLLTDDMHVREYDFEDGLKLTLNDWERIEGFKPEAFIFHGLTGEHALTLHKADVFARDEQIGSAPIRLEDAEHGEIAVIFRRSGAEYRLTYRVEKAL